MKFKYFWVVLYDDGTASSQFDPDSGKENSWSNVDKSKIRQVSWVEFSKNLAKKVNVDAKSVKNPQIYSVNFGVDDKLLICRRNYLSFSSDLSNQKQVVKYIIEKNDEIIIELE